MSNEKNLMLFEEAKKHMVGGGCAGGRINHVLGHPLMLTHADKAHLYTVDGEDYIDYHCSAGATMFGFNNQRIKEAILEKCIGNGFFMNYESEYTLEFAKLFKKFVPGVEKIRLTNSGTEATMAAIRAARAYTGKDLIIKMDGHFHGMHEMVWYNHNYYPDVDEYGEVVETVPDSAGFPQGQESHVKVIEYNNLDAVKHVVKKYKGQIAAIILEAISYNSGTVPTTPEYLQAVRKICDEEGIVMIMDEVITGMRFAPGSAQQFYGVTPDLSTFAKAIVNGFSVAVIAGKAKVMDMFNPVGPVTCSGTSTGNQMGIIAGIECLKMAMEPGFYEHVDKLGNILYGGMNDLMKKHGIPGHVRGHGCQGGIFFGYEDPEIDFNLREIHKRFNIDMSREFVKGCLENKLYFHYYGDGPAPHHIGYGVSHTEDDLALTLERMDKVFGKLASMKL